TLDDGRRGGVFSLRGVCELAHDSPESSGASGEQCFHRRVGSGRLWTLVHLAGENVSKIVIDFSGLRQTTWQQYSARFLVGGIITALVGLIGRRFGPGIGGLFLAFPAIFPASATLIEKHELQ